MSESGGGMALNNPPANISQYRNPINKEISADIKAKLAAIDTHLNDIELPKQLTKDQFELQKPEIKTPEKQTFLEKLKNAIKHIEPNNTNLMLKAESGGGCG